MKKFKWRPILLILFLFTIFLSLTLWFAAKRSPFRSFCDTIFIEKIKDDTLGLHFTLAYPGKLGIETKKVSLPLYNRDNALASYQKIKENYETLKSFDVSELTTDEKYTHTLLLKAFSKELTGQQFFYLQEAFSPSGGAQLQYPILMAEYPFRNKDDIENYLQLLKLTPSYFECLCDFETEKASRGFCMADYSLKKVINQCNTIVTKESLRNNEHFLITTFTERINEALQKRFITKKEASDYISMNRQYLISYVLPAYENLAKTLSGFYGVGKNNAGLSHFREGREYYEWLFHLATGSDVSMKTAYETLAKDYYRSLLSLKTDLQRFRSDSSLTEEDLLFFPLTDSEEMLKHLRKEMAGDFPSVTSSFDVPALPATIKEVSPALEDFTAPAYYLVPPLDDNSQNSIYINSSSVPSGLQLYTTLAHEGYPGHLYQTTYYQIYRKEHNQPYLRSILNYGGYIEGWALYTEMLSYSYAAKLLVEETGNKDYELLYDIYSTERLASLSLLSLLDIGIHYYGLDYARVKELLAMHGIQDEDTVSGIFEYIVEEPANYPKYYWSYLEILSLKEEVRQQMGEYYNDYSFHRFFLESGPSDFTSLREKIKEE